MNEQISDQRQEINSPKVREALRHLLDVSKLGNMGLAQTYMVDDRLRQRAGAKSRQDRGFALKQILEEEIHALFDETSPIELKYLGGSSYLGAILYYRHVYDESIKIAAQRMHRSTQKINRDYPKAVDLLGQALKERNEKARLTLAREGVIEDRLATIQGYLERAEYERVINISRSMYSIFFDFGFWDDYITISSYALKAAFQKGDFLLAEEIRVGNLGRLAYERKQFEYAESIARTALATIREGEGGRLEGEGWRLLGLITRERGDNEASYEFFEKSCTAFQRAGELQRYLDVLGSWYVAYRRKKMWKQAEDLLMRVSTEYDKFPDGKAKMQGIAMTKTRWGTFYLEQALDLDEGNIEGRRLLFGKAEKEWLEALPLEEELGRIRSAGNINRKLAELSFVRGNLINAEDYYKVAEGILQSRGYPDEIEKLDKVGSKIRAALAQ